MRNSVMMTVVLVALSFSGSVFGQAAKVTSETSPTEPWNEKIKGDVDEAIRLSADDPVRSLLTFKSVMDRGTDGPTQTQKAWLSAKVESLRPRALKTLQTDFDESARANDFRTALIASTVADKIGKASLVTQPSMTELKNRVFVGSPDLPSVWAVSNVVARFIEAPYSEGSSFNSFTLTPKEGFRFLRLTASVRNTSPLADKSYALWATEDLKRVMVKQEEHTPPYLWLDGSFIFLLTPASDLIPCSHVCEGCGLHGTMSFTISDEDGTGRAITMPQSVESGKELDIDVIFSVPQGIADYRLLVLGSTPITLKMTPAEGSLK